MFRFPSGSRCSGRHARMVVIAAAAVSVLAVGTARADVTDELLNQLVAKGVLTKGEFVKLKARHEAEKATMARSGGPGMHRHMTRQGVVMVPDDRYVTRLDKGIGVHIGGMATKEGVVGGVDVKISGDLVFGADETFERSGAAPAGMAGGLVTASPNQPYNAIQAGLLPSAIVLSIATNQMGYDLGFTIGAYTGGNNVSPVGGANANGPGSPIALGTPGIDLRQIFGTVGTPTFGTVKIGRDLGLFGSDAILNDATLLGMGSPLTTNSPANTTLGRIGIGYVYADWIPQITYTTPDFNGFTASIGAFTPLDATDALAEVPVPGFVFSPVTGAAVAAPNTTALYTGQETPMVQGQIKWKGDLAPGAKVTLSADGLWQEHRVDTATGSVSLLANGSNVESWGGDGFGKLDIDGFSFVAYGYYGRGLGTTGLFLSAFDALGNPRTSYGGYAQGSYTWDKFTFGASWGVSALNATAFDITSGFAPGLVRDNESIIGFLRYQLTPWMALQAEFGHTWDINQVGQELEEDDVWLGTAWFF